MSPIFEIYIFQKKFLRDAWASLRFMQKAKAESQLDYLTIMNKTLVKSAAKKEQKLHEEKDPLAHEEAPYLSLTAKAAAVYHEAAAIAPGSGTDARISPET